MASVRDGALVRSIGVLYDAGANGGLSDGQLLERVAAGRGESSASAFEAIVARHGPMVLSVCRRALDDPHDAQDAFQATFLVLARRARSIREGDALASWLFGVARRVCDRARTAAARRRLHERRAGERTASAEPDDDRHDYAALHEEVARLPDRYRLPVVLCYLEGLTYEAAADRLRCPLGTLSIRLSRARDRLRSRLLRRGLTASAGLLIAAGTASAGLSERLAATTSGMALRFIGDRAMGGGEVPAAVAGLARGVLDAMRATTRIKVLAGILGLAAIAGAGAGALARGSRGPGDDPKAEAAPTGDLAKLQGTWDLVDPDGKVTTKISWEIRGAAKLVRVTEADGTVAEYSAGIRLDERAEPRAIDVIRGGASNERSITRGIYRVAGDELTVCLGLLNAPRPAEFRAVGGESPTRLVSFRRRPRPPAAVAVARTIEGDLARLQGAWVRVDPGSMNKDVIWAAWEVVGKTLIHRTRQVDGSETEHLSEIRLDERLTPRGVDLVRRSRPMSPAGVRGEERDVIVRGIYKIEGDTLTVSVPRGMDKPRPRAFGGEASETIVLRRPARAPEPARPAEDSRPAPRPAVRGDLARLQGAWVSERDGPDGKTTLALTFAGDVAASTSSGPSRSTKLDLKVRLDESATPRSIDTETIGPEPTRLIGIYRLEGDAFTIHMTTPDRPRPTDFEPEPDNDAAVIVFRRKPGR
jgi:RNA polymerase sigma factor (sigma-70 family)